MSTSFRNLARLCRHLQQKCILGGSRINITSQGTCRRKEKIDQDALPTKILQKMASQKEIFCPSTLASLNKFIVPGHHKQTIEYSCPSYSTTVLERLLPPLEQSTKIEIPPTHRQPKKELTKKKTTLLWRHKKMKKHQLRLHRWKHSALYKLIRLRKESKRKLEDKKVHDEIRRKADDFDAERAVLEWVEEGRRAGYRSYYSWEKLKQRR